VLISESRQFIFIHVQKTGGTSIRAALRPFSLDIPRSRYYSILRAFGLPRDYRKYKFPTHCSLSFAQKILPEEVFATYFKFAFVRNPWERLVSEYNAAIKKSRRRRHRRIRDFATFHDYVAYEARRGKLLQFEMLTDRNGKLGLDFIGRYENLAADFQQGCERIGVQSELPHLNVFPHEPYQSYYTPDTSAFVRRHWARDIEAFDYDF